MASPKNYKTNTSKKASAKKSVSRKPVKKGFSSHVGLTKLTRRSIFKPWMAIPAIMLVALAGYTFIQFSHAGNLNETLPMISSTCTTVHKQSGQAARQCLAGQSIKYGISVGKGTYKVCFSATASDNSSWALRVKKNSSEQVVTASSMGVNKQYGITSITPCTSNIIVTGPNTKLAISLTTSKSGSSKDGTYKGVYVYGAKLSGDGSNSSPTDAGASEKQQKIDECNAKPDFTKTVAITGGTRQSKYGYRWEGSHGCQPYLITANLGVSCASGYTQQGNTCKPNPKPDPLCNKQDDHRNRQRTVNGGARIINESRRHYIDCRDGKRIGGHWGAWFTLSSVDATVYAVPGSVKCPKIDGNQLKSYTQPYKGKNQYSCKFKVPGETYSLYAAPTSIQCYSSDKYEPRKSGDKWRYCARKPGK